MQSRKPSFFRRTFLVEKAFQIKFILKIVSFVIVSTIITGFVTYFLTYEELERSFYSIHYQIKNVWQILVPAVVVISFVTTGITAFFTTIISLFESHKVGGPLFRFKETLKQIGTGDLDVLVKIRESDELQDFIVNINTMTLSLKEKVATINKSYEEVKGQLNKVNKTMTANKNISDDEKKLISELNQSVDELGEDIRQFKFKG